MGAKNYKTPDLYALLIGIDYYLNNKLPGGVYYPGLRGCVRDVSHVEAFLRNRFELPEGNILKLTATKSHGDKPTEPMEKWPTYENMVKAFRQLTDMAMPGDHVLVHYAGHGGRAKTLFKERKGPDGIDETLVPTDIGSSEARYLRDLELAKLLEDMVAKGLVVAVILDSCHSGGMIRGGADVAVRGIGIVDTTKGRDSVSDVGSRENLLRAWDRVTEYGARNVSLGSGWLPEPKGYTLLAACRPSESAYEYAFDGKERNGALTYWLLDSLQDIGVGLSYKVLHDRIVAKVHSQFENQTPQLQGEGDRVFFGSKRVQAYYSVPVMEVDVSEKRLRLGAGKVHGLRRGAQFAVYPHGSEIHRPELRRSVAEITEPGSTDSWAVILEEFAQPPAEPGAQAVLMGAGSVRLVQKVFLSKKNMATSPAEFDPEHALLEVGKALESNGWVEVAEEGDQIDYNVAVNASGNYEIWDRTGSVIPNLRPVLNATERNTAGIVAQRLIHLAKFNAVKQLHNHDAMSPLAHKLEVELIGRRAVYDPADPFEPEALFTEPGHTPILKIGEWTGLRIKNLAAQKINVTVLDMQPDWGVSQVYPSGPGDYFVEFEPKQELVIPLQARLPQNYHEGKDVLKVFATIKTTSFRWLELPALDQPLVQNTVVRGTGPGSPLEELMAAFTAEQPPTRALVPAAYPSHGWTTIQVEVHIKR
jgi:hypothetical protein